MDAAHVIALRASCTHAHTTTCLRFSSSLLPCLTSHPLAISRRSPAGAQACAAPCCVRAYALLRLGCMHVTGAPRGCVHECITLIERRANGQTGTPAACLGRTRPSCGSQVSVHLGVCAWWSGGGEGRPTESPPPSSPPSSSRPSRLRPPPLPTGRAGRSVLFSFSLRP